MAEVSEVF